MFSQELQCFIAVSEALNFTAAANQLYISQPGLSKIISNLEKDLNVRLFDRNTRNVSLTESGEYFLSVVSDFLHRCEVLDQYNPKDSLSTPGQLTIGMGDLTESLYFPKIVNQFSLANPLCHLSIKRYDPKELLDAIDSGEADFGIMTSYAIPPTGYQYRVYYPSPLMLVVPPSHRFANRESVSMTELKNEYFVTINRSASWGANRIQSLCENVNFVPKVKVETNSLSTMFMLIAAGKGISINFHLHKASCTHDLRFIPLDIGDGLVAAPTDGAALVWAKTNDNPSKQAFIDCIEHHLSKSHQGSPKKDT